MQLAKTFVNTCFKRVFCNIRFTKNTFKTGFDIGFRELQKNPDIYEFFPIQWCMFQNFFGSKKKYFIFLKKKPLKRKHVVNVFFI